MAAAGGPLAAAAAAPDSGGSAIAGPQRAPMVLRLGHAESGSIWDVQLGKPARDGVRLKERLAWAGRWCFTASGWGATG